MSRLSTLRQLDTSTPEATKQSLARLVQELDTIIARLDGVSRVDVGYGTPEGLVARPVGWLYLRLDGAANTTLYVKESGTSREGWAAK